MRTLRMAVFLTFATFVLVGFCGSARADEMGPWNKLERGAINTTTGWLELGAQPYHEINDGNQPVADAFLGFGKGILAGLQRTGYGLSDALSFPLEPHDRPVMEPATLFDSK